MDVRTLCLGILSRGDASGYEIKKLLAGPYRHFYDASYGAIYPALARLAAAGHVRVRESAGEGRRARRKVYAITQAGRLALVRALSTPPRPDRVRSEFLVVMLHAHALPPREVAGVIDRRLAETRERIACLESLEATRLPPAERFVLGYGLAVYRATLAYVEANRHLVEGAALGAPPPLAEPRPTE